MFKIFLVLISKHSCFCLIGFCLLNSTISSMTSFYSLQLANPIIKANMVKPYYSLIVFKNKLLIRYRFFIISRHKSTALCSGFLDRGLDNIPTTVFQSGLAGFTYHSCRCTGYINLFLHRVSTW